jgi:hypothetical protein
MDDNDSVFAHNWLMGNQSIDADIQRNSLS